ncbi:response regulator [Roseateles sp. BYS180W]|uniref:Response regulator n=1 Tax=Roseateles rivi TaxID=3299028 RepID=A0ABW7FUZ8_9BURK
MSNKGKILVVDDDRLVLATLVHGLAQAGYAIIDADNGDEAILLARQHRPDLALLDIRMEGLSGFDVAHYLRDHLRIPFMFLSAFSDEDTLRQVKDLGALAYLVKPLDIHQIVPAVEAAFANRRAAPEPATKPSTPSLANLDPLAVALGIVMQRHDLTRTAALARLQEEARLAELTPQGWAQRLIATLEAQAGA